MELLVWNLGPFGESSDQCGSSRAKSTSCGGTGCKNCCVNFVGAVLGLPCRLFLLGYPIASTTPRNASSSDSYTNSRQVVTTPSCKCETLDVSALLTYAVECHTYQLTVFPQCSPVNLITYNLPTEYRVLFMSFGKYQLRPLSKYVSWLSLMSAFISFFQSIFFGSRLSL